MAYQKPIEFSEQQMSSIIEMNQDGTIQWNEYALTKLKKWIPDLHCLPIISDLVTPTLQALKEDLLTEFSFRTQNYHWFYYRKQNQFVRLMPRQWHQLALLTRNSSLIYPKNKDFDWSSARTLLENQMIGIAGASVGSCILHATAMLIRPHGFKIADPKKYNLNNGNRVRFTFQNIGQSKADVCAEQLHEIDPYLKVFSYSEGINSKNINAFVNGLHPQEPKLNLLVEETDHPSIKVLIRESARQARIPLVMVTDIGCAVQVDVRRFDLDAQSSLCVGVNDELLYDRLRKWEAEPQNKILFAGIAFALSGEENIQSVTDFKSIILNQVKTEFAGIPQLASATHMGAGLAAWTIAKILLGYDVPERIFINPNEIKS